MDQAFHTSVRAHLLEMKGLKIFLGGIGASAQTFSAPLTKSLEHHGFLGLDLIHKATSSLTDYRPDLWP